MIIENNNNFLCLVLAGGLSRRFGGGIKTLAKINNQSIFEKIIFTLKKQNTKIIINSNFDNQVFLNTEFTIIKDVKENFQGPLAGIYSAMKWINKKKLNIEWVLSVPSDTPFLPKDILEVFKSKIKNNINLLIARYKNKAHPVIGLWHISLLNSLETELNSNNRKIMNWVQKNNYDFVDFENQLYDPFFNINTKEDILEAERIDKIISELS